jgi:hypothetical protein
MTVQELHRHVTFLSKSHKRDADHIRVLVARRDRSDVAAEKTGLLRRGDVKASAGVVFM